MPKVAAIQFTPVFKDKIGNLRRSARLVMEAAEKGASLIVLPELAHEGYSFMNKAEAEPFAEQLVDDDPHKGGAIEAHRSMDVMRALAKKYGVYIAWGLAEKDPGTSALYNTQVLMGPDWIYESYRKVNRFGSDYLWARPGRGNPPVMKCTLDGQPKKVGLLICRDVRDKKDSHWDSFYEKGDAELVAFSANWGKAASRRTPGWTSSRTTRSR
jgi:predicted amidohydrolase